MYFQTRAAALRSPLAMMCSKLSAEQLDRYLSEQRPRPIVPGLRVEANVSNTIIKSSTGFAFDADQYREFKEFVRGIEDALGLAETPAVSRPAKTIAR